VEIKSFRHKGLGVLAGSHEPRNVKGVPAEFTRKLHQRLTLIQAAANIQQLGTMPWRLHPLEPKTSGRWSLWVNANFRLTFRLDPETNSVSDVDLEDYH
jgi:proteic killer suppression protein